MQLLVQAASAATYIPAYKAVIGAVPKPAFEDYRERIKQGEVGIAETAEGAVGVAVLEPLSDHLLIYSIAVLPRYQGLG